MPIIAMSAYIALKLQYQKPCVLFLTLEGGGTRGRSEQGEIGRMQGLFSSSPDYQGALIITLWMGPGSHKSHHEIAMTRPHCKRGYYDPPP